MEHNRVLPAKSKKRMVGDEETRTPDLYRVNSPTDDGENEKGRCKLHTRKADMALGATPDVYAFSRQTIHRNLYRVPLS